MFGFVILSSELDNLLNYLLPMPELLQDVFNTMLADENIFLSIILVGIIPAFVEEMLFRGVILGGFRENYSRKKAVIISSLLFGIIHLNPWQFVTAFVIGIISAWICLQAKSILPSIYMHLFNNTLTVLVMKYGGVISIKGFNTAYYDRTFQPLWFNAIGIILTGIGALLLINSIKKAKNGTSLNVSEPSQPDP
jgi:membrane protease YdiL (CAAX protease family)